MKSIFIYAGIAVATIIIGTVLYQNQDNYGGGGDAVNQPRIVASFYPLYYFAERIVGNQMMVVNIGEGTDPHDFQPTTRNVQMMQDAQIVLLQGAGLEPWGEDIEQQLIKAGTPVFVANEELTLIEGEHTDTHDESEEKVGHEEEMVVDEHDEDLGEAHKEDDHEHGRYDPHTWLDPVLAAQTVENMTQAIAATDPENTSVYEQNAQNLIEELMSIDTEYTNRLANCSVEEALISHDSFSYVAHRYGLEMHPIAGISTKDEPSVRLLAKLREEAREGVSAILTDETGIKQYAETLSRETGLQLVSIDPLAAGVAVVDGDFIDGMRANLDALAQAYECN